MWKGKFLAPCMEKVKTLSSPAKIAAVPSPWWTSRSTTSARSMSPSRWSVRAATAMSLKRQKPVPQRRAGRGDGAEDARPRSRDQRLAPGESEPALFRLRKRSGEDRVQVLRGVGQEERGAIDDLGLLQLLRAQHSLGDEAFPQQPVFRHGEAVAGRKWDLVRIAEERAHGRRLSGAPCAQVAL